MRAQTGIDEVKRQEEPYRGEGLNESKAFQLNCVSTCDR